MATIDDLYEIAEAFLEASQQALDATPAGAPDRAFVSPGAPALDCCDQLTVHTTLLTEADLNIRTTRGALGAAKAINRGGFIRVAIAIQITRCVPIIEIKNGKPALPPVADMQAAARMIEQDGWSLWVGISESLKHGTLSQICSGAERLGGTKLEQQGGCGGWLFTYRYPLEGGKIET